MDQERYKLWHSMSISLDITGYKNNNEKLAPSIKIPIYWRVAEGSNAQTLVLNMEGLLDSRVPSIAQLLHSSLGPERSHLHLDLRH